MVGKNHKDVILTLVERTTRLTKMRVLPHRKAALVSNSSIELLSSMPMHSITFDNDKEFAHHAKMTKALRAEVYFAKPSHPWERGTNENTNGLTRQFFDKGVRLDQLDPQRVNEFENLLNNRPRKVLGYLTPLEAMAKIGAVALRT